MITVLLAAIKDVLFPPLCHVCRNYIPGESLIQICAECRESIHPITSPHCSICGIPFVGAGTDHPCGDCLKKKPAFATARSAVTYDGKARELVHSFKYHNCTQLQRSLAGFMIPLLPEANSSSAVLIPVPLHRERLRQRTFNQSVLLARVLARECSLSLEVDLLQRIRPTLPQISLSPVEREKNVRGAFLVGSGVHFEGKTVFLVDDVYTTGSTVRECSRVLLAAGSGPVHVITFARAVAGLDTQ